MPIPRDAIRLVELGGAIFEIVIFCVNLGTGAVLKSDILVADQIAKRGVTI